MATAEIVELQISVNDLANDNVRMKIILDGKIGAGDELMISITTEIGNMKVAIEDKVGATDDVVTDIHNDLTSFKNRLNEMFANETEHKQVVMQQVTHLQTAVGAQSGDVAGLVRRIEAAEASRAPGFGTGGPGGGGGFPRSVLECKALSSLKILQNGNVFIP